MSKHEYRNVDESIYWKWDILKNGEANHICEVCSLFYAPPSIYGEIFTFTDIGYNYSLDLYNKAELKDVSIFFVDDGLIRMVNVGSDLSRDSRNNNYISIEGKINIVSALAKNDISVMNYISTSDTNFYKPPNLGQFIGDRFKENKINETKCSQLKRCYLGIRILNNGNVEASTSPQIYFLIIETTMNSQEKEYYISMHKKIPDILDPKYFNETYMLINEKSFIEPSYLETFIRNDLIENTKSCRQDIIDNSYDLCKFKTDDFNSEFEVYRNSILDALRLVKESQIGSN